MLEIYNMSRLLLIISFMFVVVSSSTGQEIAIYEINPGIIINRTYDCVDFNFITSELRGSLKKTSNHMKIIKKCNLGYYVFYSDSTVAKKLMDIYTNTQNKILENPITPCDLLFAIVFTYGSEKYSIGVNRCGYYYVNFHEHGATNRSGEMISKFQYIELVKYTKPFIYRCNLRAYWKQILHWRDLSK